jgi:guanylate kinase
LENAKREILRRDDFNYCLVNDNFENAYQKLKKIIEEILGD